MPKSNLTLAQLRDIISTSKVAHLNTVPAALPEKKTHKFKATPCIKDGIKFDSTKEANRYLELKFLQTHGQITNLELQAPFDLNPGGTHTLKYIADFTYNDQDGNFVVEDSKGFKTKEYLKKKRLMLKVHGIKIKET